MGNWLNAERGAILVTFYEAVNSSVSPQKWLQMRGAETVCTDAPGSNKTS